MDDISLGADFTSCPDKPEAYVNYPRVEERDIRPAQIVLTTSSN